MTQVLSSLVANFRGELAALSAALIWAIASVIYTGVGRQLPPLALNFIKGGIALGFIVLTLVWQGSLVQTVPPGAIALLTLSGIIGIGFGDTAFFEALNCLGARRALLMEALAPPLTAFLALIFLQERLNPIAWVGISLTIVGVAWVVIERVPVTQRVVSQPLRGIGCGAIAALGQASGAVMSRAALAGTEISPLWSTLVRLSAGVLVLLIWLMLQRQEWQGLKALRSGKLLAIVTVTAFASTYLAIWLQQTSLKFTEAGIAQALSATSPLFVIPLAIWLGERVSPRAILGVLVALGGVWLLFGHR